MSDSAHTLSVCICTSGRPVELARCLDSIDSGTMAPLEVVVSNDSTDTRLIEQIRDICNQHPDVKYVQGPSRGLCANRNHVIAHSIGTHVLLLDDDAALGNEFVQRASELVIRMPMAIWTGDVLEDGHVRVSPTNSTFLGHFGRIVQPNGKLRNINLNCNVLPRAAFQSAQFDENIKYGYEDTDLCNQLVAGGYKITHVKELVNLHFPPVRTAQQASETVWDAERARFRTTLRSYIRWQRDYLRAAGFVVVAPLHFAISTSLNRRGKNPLSGWYWTGIELWGYLKDSLAKRSLH